MCNDSGRPFHRAELFGINAFMKAYRMCSEFVDMLMFCDREWLEG